VRRVSLGARLRGGLRGGEIRQFCLDVSKVSQLFKAVRGRNGDQVFPKVLLLLLLLLVALLSPMIQGLLFGKALKAKDILINPGGVKGLEGNWRGGPGGKRGHKTVIEVKSIVLEGSGIRVARGAVHIERLLGLGGRSCSEHWLAIW